MLIDDDSLANDNGENFSAIQDIFEAKLKNPKWRTQ